MWYVAIGNIRQTYHNFSTIKVVEIRFERGTDCPVSLTASPPSIPPPAVAVGFPPAVLYCGGEY